MNQQMEHACDVSSTHWALYKATRRDKKRHNLEYSTQMLKDAAIPFVSHNHGMHLRVGKTIDFWPGTGLWKDHETGRNHRGVKALIEHMQTLSG